MSPEEEAREAERAKCMTARPERQEFDGPEPGPVFGCIVHDEIEVRVRGVPIWNAYELPFTGVDRDPRADTYAALMAGKPLTAEQVRSDIDAMLNEIEARPIRRW